jgi:hypothetical protein
MALLFDHHVGTGEQWKWDGEANGLGGLEVDDQLNFVRLMTNVLRHDSGYSAQGETSARGQSRHFERGKRVAMNRFEERLCEIGVALPDLPKPIANYIPAKRSGNLVFTAGQVSATKTTNIRVNWATTYRLKMHERPRELPRLTVLRLSKA